MSEIKKTFPLLNEIQVHLLYLEEVVQRSSFYGELEPNEYEVLKTTIKEFSNTTHKYINELKEVKNKND